MNSSDSEEESAGMAYFLPVGIADDSPPKRRCECVSSLTSTRRLTRVRPPLSIESSMRYSMVPPGSFGPIGGRTPTAATATGMASGFHRSHSPPFLHLSASATAASTGSAATALPSTIAPSTNSLSNATSSMDGSFRLSDLGGEIHEPGLGGFNGAADATPSNIGAFGYKSTATALWLLNEEEEGAVASEETQTNYTRFPRPHAVGAFPSSASSAASASSLTAPFGGSASDSVFGCSSVASGTGLFHRPPSDLTMPSPFLTSSSGSSSVQSSRPFSSAPLSWPPASSSASSATLSAVATTASMSANPRRVFQAPPGLGGPPMNSPRRLGLSSTTTSSSSSGLQQSRLGRAFGAFSSTNDAVASASGHQFSPSLLSPLTSLNLLSDAFSGSGINTPLATDRRVGITNPELAELNSHSVKMQDVYAGLGRTTVHPQSPDGKEVQSMTVDVQSHVKAKTLTTKTHSPALLDPGLQRPVVPSVQTVKRVEKKKKQGLLSDGGSSPSLDSARDVPASSESVGRVVNVGHGKASTVTALKADDARTAPGALAKKKQGQLEAANSHHPLLVRRRASESPAPAAVDAAYESSSDSTELELSPSVWTSPASTLVPAAEKNDSSGARVSKRSGLRSATHEKTPTRRQVYREKQPKETTGTEKQQRLASTDPPLVVLPPSSLDDVVSPSPSRVSSQASKSDVRDSKTRARRPKVAQLTSTASDALSASVVIAADDKTALPSSASSFLRSDSSDVEVPKRKKSPKQASKPAAGDLETKASRRPHPSPQPSSSSHDTVAANRITTADTSGSPRSGASKAGKASSVDDEKAADGSGPRVSTPVRSTQPETPSNENAAATEAVSVSTGADERANGDLSGKRKESSLSNEEISPTELPPSPSTDPIVTSADKKQQATSAASAKEPQQPQGRKEKAAGGGGGGLKRDKSEKKKSARQQQKKEKRDSLLRAKGESFDVSDISDLDAGALEASVSAPWSGLADSVTSASSAVVSFLVRVLGLLRAAYTSASGRLNVKGAVGTGLDHLESVAAVVFSVVLLLSLHGASWFIRIHRVAFRAILTHRHIGFCFVFLYAFPFLVQYVFPWAPPWAPVCLWYAFLVQLFCTNGSTAMVTTFRILLPLVFLVEGISHHSFLLDLNGAIGSL